MFNRISFGPGWIGFLTPEPFTDEATAIACRFVDVFSGAYARFRELKEKEEQNRELMIQNALERVRARALGMQESGELSAVAQVMFSELTQVGVTVGTAAIDDWDEASDRFRSFAYGTSWSDAIDAAVSGQRVSIQDLNIRMKELSETEQSFPFEAQPFQVEAEVSYSEFLKSLTPRFRDAYVHAAQQEMFVVHALDAPMSVEDARSINRAIGMDADNNAPNRLQKVCRLGLRATSISVSLKNRTARSNWPMKRCVRPRQ